MDNPFGTLSIPSTVSWAAVGADLVVLELTAGQYYGLNELAARVFQGVQKGLPLSQIHRALVDEFEVDADVLRRDIEATINTMIGQKILQST